MVMKNWVLKLLTFATLAVTAAIPALAQEQSLSEAGNESPPRFGSPDQVDNQIAEDKSSVSWVFKERLVEPYFEWIFLPAPSGSTWDTPD